MHASATEPPTSVTNFIPVVFGVEFYIYSRTEAERTDAGRTESNREALPKNKLMADGNLEQFGGVLFIEGKLIILAEGGGPPTPPHSSPWKIPSK